MKIWAVVFWFAFGLMFGRWTDQLFISSECSDITHEITVIGGHSYFCADYDATRKMFQTLLDAARSKQI